MCPDPALATKKSNLPGSRWTAVKIVFEPTLNCLQLFFRVFKISITIIIIKVPVARYVMFFI